MDDYFNDVVELTSREAYNFYKKNRKKTAPGLNDYNLYCKAVKGLFSVVSNMLVESPGGVHLNGIGYFANVISPVKSKKRGKKASKSLLLRSQKKYRYFPVFFPDFELKHYSMDGTSSQKVIWETSISYKLHFDLVLSNRIGTDVVRSIERHRAHQGEHDYRGILIKNLQKNEII